MQVDDASPTERRVLPAPTADAPTVDTNRDGSLPPESPMDRAHVRTPTTINGARPRERPSTAAATGGDGPGQVQRRTDAARSDLRQTKPVDSARDTREPAATRADPGAAPIDTAGASVDQVEAVEAQPSEPTRPEQPDARRETADGVRRSTGGSEGGRPRTDPSDDRVDRHEPAARGSVQRCAIVVGRSGPRAEFQVVLVDGPGEGPPLARSPAFRIPRSGVIADRGEARTAHSALVTQLNGAGWELESVGAEWHKAVFVRDEPDEAARRLEHCAIASGRNGRDVRFEALQLDDYGNARRLAASPSFTLRPLTPLRPTDEARAMHAMLVGYLQRQGWEVDESASDDWFGTRLRRSRT
jgi:hypothetical protein